MAILHFKGVRQLCQHKNTHRPFDHTYRNAVRLPAGRRPPGWIVAAALLLLSVSFSNAQPSPAASEDSRRIHITADKLVTDHHHRMAEFIGNVRAQQNKTLIQSDRMKIFYRIQDTPQADKDQISARSMDRIEADGNVRITMEDNRGVAPHAVYTADNRTLVLSGSGAKLISGENTISGSRIVLNRTEGTITVESEREKRVEAVIFSEGSGL